MRGGVEVGWLSGFTGGSSGFRGLGFRGGSSVVVREGLRRLWVW
jgi:hypothetical protein